MTRERKGGFHECKTSRYYYITIIAIYYYYYYYYIIGYNITMTPQDMRGLGSVY